MEKIIKAYEALFMLVGLNVKKALAFAEAIPKDKIYPELLLPYLKSENKNTQDIAEALIMKAPVRRLNYLNLAKSIESGDELVQKVILLIARKISKGSLNFQKVVDLTANPAYPQVRQYGFTLLVMNFIDDLSLQTLIRCQEVKDDEFASVARELAITKKDAVRPCELFDLLDTEVANVKKLVRDICLLCDKESYLFDELYKILKRAENKFSSYLAALILLKNFSDRLTYEDLNAFKLLGYEEINRRVLLIIMERFSDKLNLEDYLLFRDSGSDVVKMKARNFALSYPIDSLNQNILLKYLNNESPGVATLAVELLNTIPDEQIDYKLLIEHLPCSLPFAYKQILNVLRRLPVKIFDPEVLAVYTTWSAISISGIATELALKIPSDYSKEADEFVKNHFND